VPSGEPLNCQLNDDFSVTCGGELATLGNVERIDVVVDVAAGCKTRGNENEPRGHIQGVEEDIPVRSGRATLDVTTDAPSCPNGLNPTVGRTATITVFEASTKNNVIFEQEVRIT
jgi:hypothetical protein